MNQKNKEKVNIPLSDKLISLWNKDDKFKYEKIIEHFKP